MKRVLCYLVFLAIWPTLVLANTQTLCDELWFARNAMLNDAGYCFTTPLGRSLFDNTDCTTRQPVVDRSVSEQISIIQNLERDPPFAIEEQRCRVDTSQQTLDQVPYIDLRRQVAFQPATDGSSGGCIGYQGRPFPLFAAPDSAAAILGTVEQGFSFSLSHLPWGEWNFAFVWRGDIAGDPWRLGWYRADIGTNCAIFAG
ncbi:MAG: DUF4453 domain-containing protein [Pseudomonadota bacterium]